MKAALVALTLLLGAFLRPGAPLHAVTYSEYAVRWWAIAYGLDGDRLWAMALCESSGSPWAVGPASAEGNPVGLFQFKPGTYEQQRYLLNQDATLAPHLTSFDPEARGMEEQDGAAEAHVAAWSIYQGYAYLWECKY